MNAHDLLNECADVLEAACRTAVTDDVDFLALGRLRDKLRARLQDASAPRVEGAMRQWLSDGECYWRLKAEYPQLVEVSALIGMRRLNQDRDGGALVYERLGGRGAHVYYYPSAVAWAQKGHLRRSFRRERKDARER